MYASLVVTHEKSIKSLIASALKKDATVDYADKKSQAISCLEKRRYDILFINLDILTAQLPPNNYLESLKPFQAASPFIQIIVLTPQERIREAVRAVKAGANDYLVYPIDPNEIDRVLENIKTSFIIKSELDYLREQFWITDSANIVNTQNDCMTLVFKKIKSVAPTKTTVLLTGETGTGKGLLAKLLHRHSNRSKAQFISLHCGAIPDTLLESELFGHEKGAFTGATKRKLGKFEIANNGTIFLDEIGTITPSAQIKLLQVLQDGTFSRLGGEESLKTNARIISATNVDLKKMTADGLFRNDLYYRLNVFPIEIPALRERVEDIPLLAEFFLKRLNQDIQKDINSIHPQVIQAFQQYEWPGNIRELENVMERAYILETASTLTPESIPIELIENDTPSFLPLDVSIPLADARRIAIDDFERQYLKALLVKYNGRINKSAEASGISTRQLHKLMVKYGIRKEDFKNKN